MAKSVSKIGAKVNREGALGGSSVPKRGGVSDQRKSSPNRSMNAPQLFTKASTNRTANLPAPGKGRATLTGAPIRRSGRGGRGPTLGPIG